MSSLSDPRRDQGVEDGDPVTLTAQARRTAGDPPVPHTDDQECRAIAERINRDHPQWLVLWGTYSRCFWAFPLFEMQPRMVVYGGHPDALTDRMQEAERRYRTTPDQQGTGNDDPARP
jgi:hypothetical protein